MSKNISFTSRGVRLAWIICLLLAFRLGASLEAAQIQGVTVHAFSLQYDHLLKSTPERRYASNLVSNIGLSGNVHAILPGGAMWLAAVPNGQTGAGSSTAGTNFVVFNLGALHTVDAMKVWNYNENNAAGTLTTGTNQGVKLANISYSVDGVNFTTNLAEYTFSMAPGTYSAFPQTIPMGGVTAQYVRIDILTNWNTVANKPVGLSKVRFVDNSVRPTIVSATRNYNSNQVTVSFSEPMDPTTATSLANYAVASGGGAAQILSAAMNEFGNQVLLQTTPLTNSSYSLQVSGVYDQDHIISVVTSTVDIKPELILWLKADAGIVTDEFGSVTQWNDQSGYGHNAKTDLVVNQYSAPPTFMPDGGNGLPAVSFNGAQLMNVPHDSNLQMDGDVTVCLVLQKTSSALADPISKTGGEGMPYTGTPPRGYTNNLPAPFDYQINASQKSVWVWGNADGGAPAVATSTGALVPYQFYIVTMVMRGTNSSWYLNGSFNGSTRLLLAPADAGNPIMLGVRLDSGNVGDAGAQFTGALSEVMILRGSTSPADLLGMNKYLGAKYGISIDALGITEQPQNATAQVGGKATFWVNAVGVPPVSYQWKSNGVSIAGATGAIYITPPLSLSANGASYSVSITTPVGSTNSDPAILQVVGDNTPPTVFSATKILNSPTNVLVLFSEAVEAGIALDPANYALTGSTIDAVSAGTSPDRVVLTTSPLDPSIGSYLTVRNVRDMNGNGLVSETVPLLPAKLALYLRGNSGVQVDSSGNQVFQWLDQTTNGNNASQFMGGAASRPRTGGAINGIPALNFASATGSYLQAASSPSLEITGDMSVVVLANLADLDAPRHFVGKTKGNTPAPYDYYVRPDRSQINFYRGNGTANAAVTGTMPSAGVPHVVSVTMSGNNVSHYLDGNGNGTGVLTTTIGDTGTPLKIGSRDDLSQFMNGDMAEIMIFGAALTTNERRAIDNYLGQKYFSFSISQQPADVVTPQGVTATFAVQASQGSAHFVYQWRKDSAAIPDATNSSYTTPILAPGDTGSRYDVVISIPGLSTNVSDTATLTVNNVPPEIVSVGRPIWSQNSLTIVFSEAVDPVTATQISNYALDNGAQVLSARMEEPNKLVLTTSALNPATVYTLTVQNVKDLFGNTIIARSVPSGVYPAGTALWLSADTGVTVDGTGAVLQWDDQSGNGNNFTQPLGPPMNPQLIPAALNQRPVIRFDGTNTWMYAATSPSLEIAGDLSIFAVVTFNDLSLPGSGMIVSKTAGTGNNIPAPYDYYVQNTNDSRFYRGNGTSSALVRAKSTPSSGTPHVMGVTMQGTTVTHRLDGVQNGTGTLATAVADGGQPVFIGTRYDTGIHLNGDIAELVVLGSAASSNDVAALERYLGEKYGLMVGPAPRLSIGSDGPNLLLSWPTPTVSFVLQTAADLAGGAWATATNEVQSVNGTDSARINPTDAQRFFRLLKQ